MPTNTHRRYDIHRYDQRLRSTMERIYENPAITARNTRDVEEYHDWLEDRGLSESRRLRYLQSAKKVMEHNPGLHLLEANEAALRRLHRQIQDSRYYHSEYSEETKKEYIKFLRSYMKWATGGDNVPDKAAWMDTTVSRTQRYSINAADLPTPRQLRILLQHLSTWKYQTLLLVHWELGSRIGETLNLRIRDYQIQDPRRSQIVVHGNKESHDRTNMLYLSKPAIDHYLDHGHPAPDDPDAMLFPRRSGHGLDGDTNAAHVPCGYNYFDAQLRQIKEDQGLRCAVNTHIFRKARITFLKTALQVNEANIDHRVGHVIGSDQTRGYTQADDTSSNSAYGSAYGVQEKQLTYQDDIIPRVCTDCGNRDPGWCETCTHCDSTQLQQEDLKQDRHAMEGQDRGLNLPSRDEMMAMTN